jgi:hypothetical protein
VISRDLLLSEAAIDAAFAALRGHGMDQVVGPDSWRESVRAAVVAAADHATQEARDAVSGG